MASSMVTASTSMTLVRVQEMISSTVAESDGIKVTGAIMTMSSTVAISSSSTLVSVQRIVSSTVASSLNALVIVQLIESSTVASSLLTVKLNFTMLSCIETISD